MSIKGEVKKTNVGIETAAAALRKHDEEDAEFHREMRKHQSDTTRAIAKLSEISVENRERIRALERGREG